MELRFRPRDDARSPWVTIGLHRFANGVFSMSVPDGFRCDLASVPGWLLWLFGPNGRHQRAALFHDAGYRYKPVAHRSTIDEIFRAIMLYDGVAPWKAWLLWAGVRLAGRSAWRRARPLT